MSKKLYAYYISTTRVLSLLNPRTVPADIIAALKGEDVYMRSALLSNSLGEYLFNAIASKDIKTLQQLAMEGTLERGTPFIYDGHVYGKGFGMANKGPALQLSKKLDGLLDGKTLLVEFAKDGLINQTAYSRLSGSTNLFVFAYLSEVDGESLRAIPYAIGDIVNAEPGLPISFRQQLQLRPEQVEQFSKIDLEWTPSTAEFTKLQKISEREVKTLIAKLLGKVEVPKDWGGEESDLFSSNLLIRGAPHTGAFLLKGPAKFHMMTMADCGKNGDQIYRLFNQPADVYVIQHCHEIGAAVRKTAEAFAFQRSFTVPCQIMFIDGNDTARLLRAYGRVRT
jgi:hypothetical protein